MKVKARRNKLNELHKLKNSENRIGCVEAFIKSGKSAGKRVKMTAKSVAKSCLITSACGYRDKSRLLLITLIKTRNSFFGCFPVLIVSVCTLIKLCVSDTIPVAQSDESGGSSSERLIVNRDTLRKYDKHFAAESLRRSWKMKIFAAEHARTHMHDKT